MSVVRTLPNLDLRIAEVTSGLEIVAIRRLGNRDDALDAVQETVARLLDRVRAGLVATEAEVAPVAWGIARHVIADMLRERARPGGEVTELASATPGPLDELVTGEEVRRVRSALAHLSAPERALLHRCFVDGERIGHIAQALGEPAERLRKRKSRALQRLAAILGVHAASGHGMARCAMEEP